MAVVYNQGIWKDMAAVEALCSLGNLNASIEAEEDEIQAFGRIDTLMTRMASSPEWQREDNIPVEAILKALKAASGYGHFSITQWKDFIALRQNLSANHTLVMKMCQFNNVAGQVKLKSHNFERVAKLHKSCPWVKVSLILYGYQLSEKNR